ncbi:MAG TPA: CYTH domain-containing protein [Microbacterium sp.]|uniref:CYTH domain-containing protein n=1 Tax=Microbacterium sp. TaxID=51671 RepID=UPI002C342C87|nr:CYTH domain-containing protein [Microbacterium sp.]HWI32584.1 CYTH domain-containing protein [Microbacterium sp.]
MTAPSSSHEIERKFDVDDQTPLPDWTGLPGVVTVAEAEIRPLDAAYWDTASLDLARAGAALRRRTGGPDAGWHLKGALVHGGRTELQWPLGDTPDIPAEVLDRIAEFTTEPLLPLARIQNERTAYALRGADGRTVAEFVDDRVRSTDLRSGARRSWREWEIELAVAAPADIDGFFAAVERAVHAAGARKAASASKLARALGH